MMAQSVIYRGVGRHDLRGGITVSDVKIDTVRSSSSEVLGRARSEARGHTLFLDSSSRPQADAFTNSEAFLRVHLDQRDPARGDAAQERLAVGERVGLGPRRRVEEQRVAACLAARPTEDLAAGGAYRVDLHVAHRDPSSEVMSTYPAIYHTLRHHPRP